MHTVHDSTECTGSSSDRLWSGLVEAVLRYAVSLREGMLFTDVWMIHWRAFFSAAVLPACHIVCYDAFNCWMVKGHQQLPLSKLRKWRCCWGLLVISLVLMAQEMWTLGTCSTPFHPWSTCCLCSTASLVSGSRLSWSLPRLISPVMTVSSASLMVFPVCFPNWSAVEMKHTFIYALFYTSGMVTDGVTALTLEGHVLMLCPWKYCFCSIFVYLKVWHFFAVIIHLQLLLQIGVNL